MSDACVAQLVRAVYRQSNDPGRILEQSKASLFLIREGRVYFGPYIDSLKH